jgi:hypothetical protein
MTDATVIIGLLVLLTFSSVSSPFGQEEQSAFFASWYDKKQQLNTVNQMLYDCNQIIVEFSAEQQPYLTSSFTDNSLWNMEDKPTNEMGSRPDDKTKGGSLEIIENRQNFNDWFDGYKDQIFSRCNVLPTERYELVKNIEVLTDWGVEFHYLRINSEVNAVESKYHLDLASGPFLANMVNLGMIFPFLFSAIVEVIVHSKRNKDDEQATKIGQTLMTIGFVSMVIGLSIIAYSFYEASMPYL